MGITLVATLALPIQYTIFLGVVVSVLHYVYNSAVDIEVMECVPQADGTLIERPAPARTPTDSVTLLHINGSMFFAGAYVMGEKLPSPLGSERAVVRLGLPGRGRIGSTCISVIERYAAKIQAGG